MKKIVLLFTFGIIAFAANAQLTLTGTSYTQNFDNIGTSAPTGWFEYTMATSTSLGTVDATDITSTGGGSPEFGAYWDTTDCPDDVFGIGFKNCASADNGHLMSTATCLAQEAETNRALGVRQGSPTGSHPGFDPGASFALELANTNGDSAFTLTFNLQSLDSSSLRITTWVLDYGIGASPTVFTPITTIGTMTTGGYTFANHAISATLPAAINQLTTPVWIRISTLTPSIDSEDRTTSAIDDFNLTWHAGRTSGTSIVTNISAAPVTSLTVIGQPATDNITLAYSVEQDGQYTLSIYDLSGRTIHTETVNALVGAQSTTVDGLYLVPGMYFAKLNNGNSSSVARVVVR